MPAVLWDGAMAWKWQEQQVQVRLEISAKLQQLTALQAVWPVSFFLRMEAVFLTVR